MYAEQYDANTAADKGGIPYVTDIDTGVENKKLSLQEVYDKILEDCSDELIALLPTNNDVYRANKAFGYAVRSKVLMQMKNYKDALPYALKALELNGTIEDRSTIKLDDYWYLEQEYQGNYMVMGSSTGLGTKAALSKETTAMFDSNNYNVLGEKSGWSIEQGNTNSGDDTDCYYGWTASTRAAVNQGGINSDRMYYTAAECMIRTGEIEKGLQYIDKVRQYRIKNYTPLADKYTSSMTEEQAMALLQPAKWVECIGT